MGDQHSRHWSRRAFLGTLTLAGTAALTGLELEPASAGPASLPTGEKWPRFGWSAAPEWQTSPGQIASNGGNSQSQALVYNWLLWPSSMTDGTTIKRILAMQPQAELCWYMFWYGGHAWQWMFPPPIGGIFQTIANNPAWCVRDTRGNVIHPGGDRSAIWPNIQNPDCRNYMINVTRQVFQTYGLNGFEWDGPPQPLGYVNQPPGPQAQNSVQDLHKAGANPSQLTTFPNDLAALFAGLLNIPSQRGVPLVALTESAGQNWWELQTYGKPLTLASNFYSAGNPAPSVVYIPFNNVAPAQTFQFLQSCFEYQHARGGGLAIAPANGNDPTWNKYAYCFFLCFSNGRSDLLGHEHGPWNFMTKAPWGTNFLLPGRAHGPATQSGSVWTRVFDNCTVTVDLNAPPKCSIG
jgi:hypothetical protein